MRHRWVITLALLLAAGAAFTEAPDWDALTSDLVTIRHHWYTQDESSRFDGVWLFNPENDTLDRVRSLSLTRDDNIPDLGSYSGWAPYLASADNRLVVQMWPHFLEFEAPSWRLLRRYSPAVAFRPTGWVTQGPMLSVGSAAAVGLEPGLYGFPNCVLEIISMGGMTPEWPCEPAQYPGWVEPRTRGDGSAMLRRGLEPAQDDVDFVASTNPYEYHPLPGFIPPSLTFDPEDQGFWRAGPRTIEFMPVKDGVVQPATIVEGPSFAPSDSETWSLFALHLHSPSGRLFGTSGDLYSHGGGLEFFALDRQLGLLETYDLLAGDGPIGWPISITSLSTQPATHQQTIPVVSHTAGRLGTFWSTDLWLYNPSGQPMEVDVRRVTRPEEVRAVELPAHGSLKITDALAWIGGGADGDSTPNDALVLTSPSRWAEELVAVSRTFNTEEGFGTYGQAVPAVPGRVGYSNHLPYDEDGSILDQVHMLGYDASFLTVDRRTPGRYRHNLGVINDHDEIVTLTLVRGWLQRRQSQLRQVRPSGAVQKVTAPPHSVSVINLEKLFPDEAEVNWPPRIAVFGDRPVLLWLSMVDNITGDATFVPYTVFQLRTDGEGDRNVLPVVASTEGKAGTRWITDAYGFGTDDLTDRPVAFFHPQDRQIQCGGVAPQDGFRSVLEGSIGMPIDDWVETMRATGAPPASEEDPAHHWKTIFPDVIHLFPECEEDEDIKGGLEIATGSWTSGYSRTYTTRDDGGTYGGMLPLYPPNGWPVQHFAGIEVSDQFRINIGLFNGDHDHTITHRLTLYRADGTEVASVEFDLVPLELRQQSLEKILDLPAGGLEEGTYGLTVLPLDDDETGVQGRSWAFVSLVDNITGDPTNWW